MHIVALSRWALQWLPLLALFASFAGVRAQTSSSPSVRPSHTCNDPEGCDSDGEDSPDDEEDSNSTRTHRPSGTGRSSAGGDPTGSLSAGTGPSGSSLGPSDGSADSGSSRLSGGAIAGIVFGIFVFILLVGAIFLLWWRRRRQLAARNNSRDSSQSTAALVSNAPVSTQPAFARRPTSIPWISPILPTTGEIAGGAHTAGQGTAHRRLSGSANTFPNPYDTIYHDDPPQSPSSPTSPNHQRDLPPLPEGAALPRPTSTTSSTFDAPSTAPSSFPYSALSHQPEAGTSSNTVAAENEALLMTSYQKRLENHHRKESEDAVLGRGVPADPPPEYRVNEDEG
ncbi:unnamed protein product [Somion occarium]|uniref:Uncharacterized protein n=1 Tax=Somion occarium TaxID=3059160 RepID=A0ABP1DIG3_9APHY